MQRTFLRVTLVAAFVGTLAAGSRPLAAAERIPNERRLPPEVKAYVTIPSVPELKARWRKTSLAGLRDEQALADFWKDVDRQIEQGENTVREKLGVGLSELLALPEGQISLAVIASESEKPAFLGFLDFGANRETVDTLLARMREALQDQGAERRVEEFEGTQIVRYELASESEADTSSGQPQPRQFAYFLNDGAAVFATRPDVLQQVLARWDGEHGRTFADNEIYRAIVERCRGENTDPLMTWYVDPVGMVRAVLQSGGGSNPQATAMLSMLPQLGFDKVRGLGGTVDLATGEYDSISRTLVHVDQPTTGVLNLFRCPPTRQSPPDWVPAQAASYFGVNWDVSGAYGTVQELVDTFQGPGTFEQIVDRMAEAESGPGLHLKTDFIDHLTGRIHLITEPAAASEDKNLQRFLIAFEVKQPDKMQAVLSKVAETPGFPGETRQFQGTTLYEIPNAAGGSVPSGAAVARGHLMIASNVRVLERILRSDADQESLPETTEYRRIAEHIPGETSMLGFQRQDTQLKAAYELLRSGQAGQLNGDLAWAKLFEKLPEFEVIEKYLPPTGSYTVPDSRGVLAVSFSLPAARSE